MDDWIGSGGEAEGGEEVRVSRAETAPLEVVGSGEAGFAARLVSRAAIPDGGTVARIEGYRVVGEPTYRSVQIGVGRHIEDIGVLAYLNHSCRPNVAIDVERLLVKALRPVQAGDELTFFYPSTEWEMARPFRCWCGAPDCLGWVRGAKHVSRKLLAGHAVAPHIARLARLAR